MGPEVAIALRPEVQEAVVHTVAVLPLILLRLPIRREVAVEPVVLQVPVVHPVVPAAEDKTNMSNSVLTI